MIPKILHIIWIGDDSRMPEQFIQTWVQHHPDWDIQLWGNADLVGRTWQCQQQVRYWGARDCAAVADIMRWEILQAHGGVCVAADSVCLRPLDDELLQHEMFACWVNEQLQPGLVSAAYVGCEPGHPLIDRIVQDIAAQQPEAMTNAQDSVGAGCLTRCWQAMGQQGMTVLPSASFIPRHPRQLVAQHVGEPYACEMWASQLGLLDELRHLPVDGIKSLLARNGPVAGAVGTTGVSGPSPDPCSLNILMMTVRTNAQMRQIIEALARSAAAHPGVRLTIADGSDDPDKHQWLQALAQSSGADVRLILEVDPGVRFRMGLASDKAWTLFAADDDPITTNYIDAYVDKLARVAPDVTAVAASLYIGQIGDRMLLRQVQPVLQATPHERVRAWQAQSAVQGMLYYGLLRTPIVRAWYARMQDKAFLPSYADQLLTALVAAQGKVAVVDQCSAQVRDESNWADAESCTRSDMRHYPHPDMVLFHEAFWVGDLVHLLDAGQRPEMASAIHARSCELLQRMLQVMPSRLPLCQPRGHVDWASLVAVIRDVIVALAQERDSTRIARLLQSIADWTVSLESILIDARPAAVKAVVNAA